MNKSNEIVIGLQGAMGDILCATPLFRNIKAMHPKSKLVVVSLYPNLLFANPNVGFSTYPTNRYRPNSINMYKYGFENSFLGRYSESWCNSFNVPFDSDKLDYCITTEEDEFAKNFVSQFSKPIIVVAPSSGYAIKKGDKVKITSNRDWHFDRWNKLCKELMKTYDIIQIGAKDERKVKGLSGYFIGQDVRFAIAILKYAKLWISVDSFIQHAGTAIEVKGIVLFGKSIPEIAGHEQNINIYKNACNNQVCHLNSEIKSFWNLDMSQCSHRNCMKTIKVKEVLDIIKHWDKASHLKNKKETYRFKQQTIKRKMNGRIEIGIPTANRHNNLFGLLATLRNQAFKEWDITIIDDGDDESLIKDYCVMHTLNLIEKEGHRWRLIKTDKHVGPPAAHNRVLYDTDNEYIFRVDDDMILTPNYLNELIKLIRKNKRIGAVSGLILHLPDLNNYYPKDYMTNPNFANIKSKRNPMNSVCLQWRNHPDNKVKQVNHLYSSFLYRAEYGKQIGGFARDLSVVGHTEETQFSFQLFLEDYKLLVTPNVKAFHFRTPLGGIRNPKHFKQMWDSDLANFMKKYEEWKQEYNLTDWE